MRCKIEGCAKKVGVISPHNLLKRIPFSSSFFSLIRLRIARKQYKRTWASGISYPSLRTSEGAAFSNQWKFFAPRSTSRGRDTTVELDSKLRGWRIFDSSQRTLCMQRFSMMQPEQDVKQRYSFLENNSPLFACFPTYPYRKQNEMTVRSFFCTQRRLTTENYLHGIFVSSSGFFHVA